MEFVGGQVDVLDFWEVFCGEEGRIPLLLHSLTHINHRNQINLPSLQFPQPPKSPKPLPQNPRPPSHRIHRNIQNLKAYQFRLKQRLKTLNFIFIEVKLLELG